jgi:LuxR family maltose regulon positive regulatory protein
MGEPSTTTLSTAARPEWNGLLATKLHRPRLRPGLVPRPRLLRRLDEGMGRELVLVCTPAGSGKTTLLADWVRGGRRPAAWLSLDAGDNDPARFWRHAAAALDGVRPGVAERVAALLGRPLGSYEGLVTTLVNELAGAAEEVVLVVDDYHLVQAPPVHQSVSFLLEHLPASLRLVVASRTDPPLPLARLRARGQLAELREADLRFTCEEAAELLGATVGRELPAAVVGALTDRTEGWVAGLQLAAQLLREHSDPAGFVAGFSGSNRYVLDYLTEEVLDRQPQPLREFMLETSVLDRLSGPLCAAVTGRADSQQLLETVERANLFLHPLDEVRGWWRYHHLFADLLRARLQQTHPDRVVELHRAAAGWFQQHGSVDDAIRHALAGGEPAWAARLIEQHFEVWLWRSEDATLVRWLEALPAEVVRRRPRLCLAGAFLAYGRADLEALERLLDEAELAVADTADEPYEPSIGAAASLLANAPAAIAFLRGCLALFRGDAEQTAAFARQALAEPDGSEWILTIARWCLAVAEWLRGRPAEAERALASSVAGWRAANLRPVANVGYQYLGQAQQAQGRLGAALETFQEALEAAAEPGRPTGMAHVGMAEVAYQRGELHSALRHATKGVALCRQLAWTMPLVAGLATVAWIRQGQGDRAGALDALRQAEAVQPSPSVVGLLNPVPALRARLALANGEVAKAARQLQANGIAAEDEPSYPREREHLVLARVLLAQQAPRQALALLERWDALAAPQGRTGSRIEIRALQALAHAACDDEPAALAALGEALALGAPEGYVRVFVDEGPPMATLVGKLLAAHGPERPAAADAGPRGYLRRLVAAFEEAGLPVRSPLRRGGVMVPGLVEPLSARELEVLELLAAGKPNRAIAEELVITVDTVKRHVRHLFGKLRVANRTQAVTRARELGLRP